MKTHCLSLAIPKLHNVTQLMAHLYRTAAGGGQAARGNLRLGAFDLGKHSKKNSIKNKKTDGVFGFVLKCRVSVDC